MVREYKCPCCGGTISFDSTLQKMKCPYCDTEFDVETLKDFDKELDREAKEEDKVHWDSDAKEWDEKEGVREYICSSCGGAIIGDATLGATSCPYCGSTVIMTEQFSGILKPQLVIPFKTTKENALEGFKAYMKGKKLLPKVFMKNAVPESLRGVYVPVWLFDANAGGSVAYKATKVRTWRDSKYRYTETSHFRLHRAGSMDFVQIPVDGSTKMEDDLMESIEPYDMKEAVDFQTAYLSGFLADRYDVDASESGQRAVEKARHTLEMKLKETVVGYTTVSKVSSSMNVRNGRETYALLPVWLYHTKWKDKNYHFAMNGQTGKTVGNLPCDPLEALKWFLIISLGSAALVFLAIFLALAVA